MHGTTMIFLAVCPRLSSTTPFAFSSARATSPSQGDSHAVTVLVAPLVAVSFLVMMSRLLIGTAQVVHGAALTLLSVFGFALEYHRQSSRRHIQLPFWEHWHVLCLS